MIHWNKRLILMLRKLIFRILIISLLITTYGCNKSITTISNAQFYDAIFDKMSLIASDNKIPYFNELDTSSYYFDIVQTLVEWGIIDKDEKLQLDKSLNNEYFCKTIFRIREIEDDFDTCYKLGYIDKLDKEALIAKDKALNTLDEIVLLINNKEFENKYEVKMDENIKDIQDVVLIDENKMQTKEELSVNDIISINNNYYQITNKDNNIYEIEKTNDVFEDLDISFSDEISFQDAYIEDESNDDNDLVFYSAYNNPITLNSYVKSKSFKYKEFDIKLTLNTSSIVVNASRNVNGNEAYISYKLYNVKPSYDIKINDHQLEAAYLKFDFNTLVSAGIKNGISKTLYADFKDMGANDFLLSAKRLFKEKQDVIDTIFTIATINVPIPNTSNLFITIKVQLVVYASGRIELSLSGDHDIGLEYRNGNMRTINDNDFKSDFVIKANTSLVAKSILGLKLNNIELMDIYADGGIKGLINTTVHLYDDNNQHTMINTDMELDFLDELSSQNDHVYVCGDIDVYNILDVGINSSKTLLAKMGLTKKLNILTRNNSSLLKGKSHLENFHFVDKCTRYNNTISNTDQIISVDNIIIEDYSLLVKAGDSVTIKIKALPANMSIDDLIFTSNNDNVKVDKNVITGLKKGNSIIEIKTKDDKYVIKCHILISDS